MKNSVIICTFNYGKYLSQCLKSVFCQSVPPDEVIVVDDGSTDDTPTVVADFRRTHNNLIYIRQENRGKAEAFNLAMSLATGDLVWHLDADDFWMPDKMKIVTQTLVTTKAAGVVHDVFSVDESGIFTANPRKASSRKARLLRLKDTLSACFSYPPANIMRIPYGMPNTICVRKAAVEDLFPLPSVLGLAVDGALLLGAARYGIYYLPKKLSAYRYHGVNFYLKNPEGLRYQIALFQWFRDALSGCLSISEERMLQILAKEATSIAAYKGIRSRREGLKSALELIGLLIRAGLIPNWKHLALPLRCFVRR